MGLGAEMGRIVELLNGKKNGFFIECGAFDGRFIVGIFERLPSVTIEPNLYHNCVAFSGERWSNTLVLELRHQWTGLLVEADPFTYRQLREKHRK